MSTWPPAPGGDSTPPSHPDGPRQPEVQPGYYGGGGGGHQAPDHQAPNYGNQGVPGGGGYSPSPPPKAGMSSGTKVLLIVIAAVGGLFLLVCVGIFGFFAYVGARGPDTFIVAQSGMRSHHLDEVREMGLVQPGEEIIYFYSNGFIDIKTGLYFITDDRLVTYSTYDFPPLNVIPFSEIEDLYLDEESSLLIDSTLTVETYDGESYYVPLSSERGRDKSFVEEIRKRMRE